MCQRPRKKLTNKQRKKYERIVATKKKKAKRAEILRALSECAVSHGELALMSSASRLGQSDQKRKLSEYERGTEPSGGVVEMVSSVCKGRKRAKRMKQLKKSTKVSVCSYHDWPALGSLEQYSLCTMMASSILFGNMVK